MTAKLTPMMQQYLEIKEQSQDAILFFRLGDFYEMFMEDAILAAKELEITLTGRDGGQEQRIPMCGVPYHAAENYIAKLVGKGYKVAICEQVQDPKEAKGIVRREIVKVITPGTVFAGSILEEKQNNYIVALTGSEEQYGLAFADLTTGEFALTSFKQTSTGLAELFNELERIAPAELVANQRLKDTNLYNRLTSLPIALTEGPSADFVPEKAKSLLCQHFQVLSLHCYGCEQDAAGISAAGGLLAYLQSTQKQSLAHITKLTAYQTNDFMLLDVNTRRNLELSQTLREQKRYGSLLWVLDYTETAMGARRLKQWLESPLKQVEAIKARQQLVSIFVNNSFLRSDLKQLLSEVYDLERLMARVSLATANARDLNALQASFAVLQPIHTLLQQEPLLIEFISQFDDLADLHSLIDSAIQPEAPFSLREGGIIRSGYHEEIDKLRVATTQGKQWLTNLEHTEKEKTGIKSLKVGFNKVFGYYIEVTKSYLALVPDTYLRKQTLANAERFITPELKEYEALILGANDKLVELEYELFVSIREQLKVQVERIQKMADLLATLDALISLAEAAVRNFYTKPEVNDGPVLQIKAGRHPVVEKMLKDQWFVPNDCYLDQSSNRFAIITGPNMAGKSTYMRQLALIVLMAQIGSYVPAEVAQIGVVDRIFTRVGAADDLATGQSTFMVEMNEVANILNNATDKSLIILDEIGRGTSTFDGLSIAWAVSEYILDPQLIGGKTLFATHYHELTELANHHTGVVNLSVAVKEQGDDVIFLRQIVAGGADKSYGIQVAKLAGLPPRVIQRAGQLLKELEQPESSHHLGVVSSTVQEASAALATEKSQLSFFDTLHPVLQEISELDLLNMNPLQALNKLYELQGKVKG